MIRETVLMAIVCLCVCPVLAEPASQPEGTPPDRPAARAMGENRSGEKDKREKKEPDKKDADKDAPAVEGVVEKAAITQHEIKLADGAMKYTATAANMLMKDEEGKLKARVFFVAYEKEHAADADLAGRNITFVFNGGPGAAAVWLHLGTAGPQRVVLQPDGQPLPPPYRLAENPFTWLDATDLVFIDPVGTGYSRPEKGEPGTQFYGLHEDISWVADFIRLYSTHYQRWSSPRFLAGESYGTTRAAGLSEYLLDRFGLALNGIVLVSTVLQFQTLSPGDANDLPYALYLPSYTAIAWYHHRLPRDLQAGDLDQALEQVRHWALNEYLVALGQGSALTPEARKTVVEQLARFTGLPADFIDRADLRIDASLFEKNLLAADRKVTGRYDARITGYDPDPVSTRTGYDPSFSGYLPVYSSTFNDYIRRVLKYDSVLPYEVLSSRVRPWRMEEGRGFTSVADTLRSAMIKNPSMKVLFNSGYYDLATPFFATSYTIDHLNLPPALRANIREAHYHAGHMLYHNQPDLESLHSNIASFMKWAVPKAPESRDAP